MDSTRSALYFHSEATRHMKLKANTLHYCTKKNGKDIFYDLSTYTFCFDVSICTVCTFIFFFVICYRIVFYVSFSLRFGLHCFHTKCFLKREDCNVYYKSGFFFCKVRYYSNFINFSVTEANSHSPLPGQQIPLRSIRFRCIEPRR